MLLKEHWTQQKMMVPLLRLSLVTRNNYDLTYTEDTPKSRVDPEVVSNKELDMEKAIKASASERSASEEDNPKTRVDPEVLSDKESDEQKSKVAEKS